MNANQDQADILATNERLTAELATAKTTNATLTAQVATITSERDSANAKLKTVTDELATAKQDLVSTKAALQDANTAKEAAEAKAKSAETKVVDFNRSVCAKITELGIRTEAIAKDSQTIDVTKLTADEKVKLVKAGIPAEQLVSAQ